MIFASAFLALRVGSVRQVPLPAWLFFGLSLYTLLQALPVPSSLVHALSPSAFEIWQGAFAAWKRPGWMSLSVDRGATLVEALKWAMYGAAFISASAYGATRNMARGIRLPVGAALAVAVITLAHGLLGARLVYGVYAPSFGPSIWHIGPLLNPNHLASYLNVGVFCGLGLLVTRQQFLPRWVVGIAVAFLIPNAIVAGSRGGIVGLLVGLAVFFAALPRRRHADVDYGPIRKPALYASVAGVLVVAGVLTGLLVSDTTRRELYDTNIDKLRLLKWASHLIWDFRWFGVGRGAFEGVYAAYHTGANHEIHTHPENIFAQWLGEWGVPVGLAALVGFVWLLRPRRLGRKWSAIGAGAVAAAGAVFVHNLADFGLEVPAIALLVVATVGVCFGHEASRASEADERVFDLRQLAPAAAVAVALCILAAGWGGRTIALDRLALAEDFRALNAASPEQVAAEVARVRESTTALSRAHPAEPYFYRLGALLAIRSDGDPMPLLGRALERGPMIGRTHLIVARVLASRHALRQALFELRLAAGYDAALTPVIARTAVKVAANYDDLLRVVPEGPSGSSMLVAMARLSPAQQRERLLNEAVARSPGTRDALALLANDFMRELERGDTSDRCGKERGVECQQALERCLTELDKNAARAAEPVILRARLLQLRGDTEGAANLLTERCSEMVGRDRSTCLKTRLSLAAKAKNEVFLAAAARDFLAENCLDADRCSSALTQIGDGYAAKQDWPAALSFYDRAAHERPDDQLWMKVAQAAIRARAYQRAGTALARVHGKAHFEPEYTRLVSVARAGQAETIKVPAGLEGDVVKR